MKHAGKEALCQLEPFLARLRDLASLTEKRPGIFYLRSRAFVHFHEDPKGLFADVKLNDDFARFPVNTLTQQERLLTRIERFVRSPSDRSTGSDRGES